MAPEQDVSANEDGFVAAKSNTEWYQNLKRFGSCLRLYDLLNDQRELIHQLGPEGTTVLHKGVEHGCVKLVKFILTEMFDEEGKCTCTLHEDGAELVHPGLTREELLRKKNVHGSTAVNMAGTSVNSVRSWRGREE
ncbi:hypothetical protein M758_1G056200 [Ceratodon purpureus]|nr:hypothetical protein M758_6G123200 [Ceratodon purpureus]KAG0628842.1 hypothetical protein M758_1G056200 [Ceratodon purpureus]